MAKFSESGQIERGIKLPTMLDTQRVKFELVRQLRAQGLGLDEIKMSLNQDKRPFRPAFINGKRREQEVVQQLLTNYPANN